jgi:nucleotide-sensitive chloride channel 1A
MEILRQPPDHSSFISLEEYQSHTPASFHDGPVVLHHYSRQCKLLIREGDLRASPALAELRGDRSRESSGTNGLTAGSSAAATESRGNISSEQDQEEEEEREVTIDNVEVWVTSQYASSLCHDELRGLFSLSNMD